MDKYHRHSSLWDYGLGVNRYHATSEFASMVVDPFNVTTQAIDNAWNEDPNTFEKFGKGLGDTVGTAGMFGGSVAFGARGFLDHNASHARKFGKGFSSGVYTQLKDKNGGWELTHGTGIPNAKPIITNEEMKDFTKNLKGTKGVYRTNRGPFNGFAKNMSMAKTLGWSFVAPLAAGFVTSKVLGVGGKILDSAYSHDRTGKQIKYDNRFFDSRANQAAAYNQIGMAMNNYQEKMVSVGRIYHSR